MYKFILRSCFQSFTEITMQDRLLSCFCFLKAYIQNETKQELFIAYMTLENYNINECWKKNVAFYELPISRLRKIAALEEGADFNSTIMPRWQLFKTSTLSAAPKDFMVSLFCSAALVSL